MSSLLRALAVAGVFVGGVVGCAGRSAAPGAGASPTGSAAGVTPAEIPLPAWVQGHWLAGDGRYAERWTEVGDALVGVCFAVRDGKTAGFEVLFMHRESGRALYTAMPGGAKAVDFEATSAGPSEMVFENLGHDHPKRIRYARSGATLRAELSGDEGPQVFELQRGEAEPASALEAADRDFDNDHLARAGTAWADRFEEQGATWPRGATRTVGPRAIGQEIDDMVKKGRTLRWVPTASGLSPAGDMGFTAGNYRVVGTEHGEADTTFGAGVYVSVWRRQPDGAWKIVFDSGISTATTR